MKNLELESFNVQELNDVESARVNGGSELSDTVLYWLGYGAHKVVNAYNSYVDTMARNGFEPASY